jgi:hypothetical protein
VGQATWKHFGRNGVEDVALNFLFVNLNIMYYTLHRHELGRLSISLHLEISHGAEE